MAAWFDGVDYLLFPSQFQSSYRGRLSSFGSFSVSGDGDVFLAGVPARPGVTYSAGMTVPARLLVRKHWPWSGEYVSAGARIRKSSRVGGVFGLITSQGRVTVAANPVDGHVYLYIQGTGLLQAPLVSFKTRYLLTLSKWYYVEIEVQRSTGRVRFLLNGKVAYDGILPFDLGLVDHIDVDYNPADTVAENGYIRQPDDRAGTTSVDDLYVSDTAAVGPLFVVVRLPRGADRQDWANDGPMVTATEKIANWRITGIVSSAEPPYSALLYRHIVFSNTLGHIDSYTSNTDAPQGNVVGMAVNVVAARTSNQARNLRVSVGSASFDISGLTRGFTCQYRNVAIPYDTTSVLASRFAIQIT